MEKSFLHRNWVKFENSQLKALSLKLQKKWRTIKNAQSNYLLISGFLHENLWSQSLAKFYQKKYSAFGFNIPKKWLSIIPLITVKTRFTREKWSRNQFWKTSKNVEKKLAAFVFCGFTESVNCGSYFCSSGKLEFQIWSVGLLCPISFAFLWRKIPSHIKVS